MINPSLLSFSKSSCILYFWRLIAVFLFLDGKSWYSTGSKAFGVIGADGLPVSVDWRRYPAVTDVRNQGHDCYWCLGGA